jgi:hypothetical protein
MGQIRDARIQDFQTRAGIKPVEGPRAERLNRMSQLAHSLIQIITLEKSGIRDGDGYWSGSDPLGGTIHELVRLEREDLAAWEAESAERDPFTMPARSTRGRRPAGPACTGRGTPVPRTL